MSNYLLKLIEFSIIMCLVFTSETLQKASDSNNEETDIIRRVKRSLWVREREYIKHHPLSPELQSFINGWKRKRRHARYRKKRSGAIDVNHMYIIEDGKIVPLGDISAKMQAQRGSNFKDFTVLPLIVPIKTTTLEYSSRETPFSTNTQNNEKLIEQLKYVIGNDVGPSPAPERSFLTERTFNSLERTLREKPEDDQVLNKILNDVEGLVKWKNKEKSFQREGLSCNVTGSWDSEVAGVQFDVSIANLDSRSLQIAIYERIPPSEEGLLCGGNWTLEGRISFPHSSIILVIATQMNSKRTAVFLGECRICEDMETITGQWIFGRPSRDCKDQKLSQKILSDVWKRDNVRFLQKKHLRDIGKG